MSNPSYHAVVVIVDGQRFRIADDYELELTCVRVAGWRLWRNPIGAPSREPVLIGGEFDSKEFRIEVAGNIICQNSSSESDYSK
jgi:hypothetical protein